MKYEIWMFWLKDKSLLGQATKPNIDNKLAQNNFLWV